MSEPWITEFESRLEQLETAAHGDGVFLPEILKRGFQAVEALAVAASPRLYLVRPSESTDSRGATPRSANTPAEIDEVLPDGSVRVAEDISADHIDRSLEASCVIEETGDQALPRQILISRPVASSLFCVLHVRYADSPASVRSFTEGISAVVEIISASVARHLVGQNDVRLGVQAAVFQLLTRLHRCEDVSEAAGVVAQDGSGVLGDCRISVLIQRKGRFHVESVTGVRQPNHDAETVRAIAQIAATAADGEWQSLTDDNRRELNGCSILYQNGTRSLCVLRVGDINGVSAVAALVIEVTDDQQRPEDDVLQQLKAAAASSLLPLWRRERPLTERLINHRGLRWSLVAAGFGLLMAFWPAEFEVEVPGQMVSSNHLRLYAPERGVIDEIYFSNEKSVTKDASLLKLSNPDIDLELRRIQGDIDTANAELRSVTARRNAGGDPELSGQEQKLLQQVRSLELEKKLVEDQRDSLLITAPFDGRVFRHNPQQELKSRPVQRGQWLLEIVPNDNQWHLEMSIPDDVEAYVRSAIQASEAPLQVRYFIRAAPDQYHTTSLKSLEDAVQIIDGQMICVGRADPGDLKTDNIRPGTSITARICCGKRSLGFVWFREIVELWQRFEFAWL